MTDLLTNTEFAEMEQQDALEPAAMLIPQFMFAQALLFIGLALGMAIGG